MGGELSISRRVVITAKYARAFVTVSCWHGPFLDAGHRARGRCENRIKTLKNIGLDRPRSA
ncbi:hypothetical protein [Pseudarthrobacter siccitolerans]|uniref:hypothetical protein n=1 Tax=Pseudarthrobacter siccitolerans TaxID=861266 RepID=UPI00128DBB39|nr:hypothetical protein [Pseudarthrobacter siccitolerans]